MSSPTRTNKSAGESKGQKGSKARRVKAKIEPKSTVTIKFDPATEETSTAQAADKAVAEDIPRNEDAEAKEGQDPTTEGTVKQEDHASESGQELEPNGNVKEEAPTEEMQEVTDVPDKHILYPGGGHFNKLRKKQVFLNQLLESCVDKYIDARNKREFVKDEILIKIPGGLHVFDKHTGDLYPPEELEAFERVAQKLRDIKKFRLNSIKRATAGNEVKPGRKSKKTSAAMEERKRKRDEELEGKNAVIASLEAEIAALRKENNEQKEELDTLKELVGADQADKRQRIEAEASPENGDSKTSGDHPEPEGTTVPV